MSKSKSSIKILNLKNLLKQFLKNKIFKTKIEGKDITHKNQIFIVIDFFRKDLLLIIAINSNFRFLIKFGYFGNH